MYSHIDSMHSFILLCCFNLLLSSSFSTPAASTASASNANETDRPALLAIMSQLHDPLQVTRSWNYSTPLCMWRGVTCGHWHKRVTELDLGNQNIGGRLSPYIGNLSFLRYINLEGNSFYGEIPSEVGRLFRLRTLILSNNSFSGTIPTNLSHCYNLVQLFANHTNLMGEIPTMIGDLLKLEQLSLRNNHLVGQLPTSIGNLSSLKSIDLAWNNLRGEIPDGWGQLRHLVFLKLNQNNLSGTVPPSIYNISSLESFSLLSNNFKGSLPLNIGLNLPNLKFLVIAQNNFTGHLPNSFSNISNLVWLDLAENHFSGKLSIDFGGLKNLSHLNLGINSLGTGTTNDLNFMDSLTNCSKLEQIGLDENHFGGVLPNSFSNLSKTMTGIAIGSNQISGTLPSSIVNLVNLNNFGVEYNQLSGSIPHAIGELTNLQVLYLEGNNLQGRIPASLGNLTLLSNLWLDSNNLQGHIPSSLGNCQNLIEFTAFGNKLTGTLPEQILGISTLSINLDLSDNLLSGPFPSQVGNLKNLIALDISRNRFSSKIPVTLSGCTSLEYLNLSGNSFGGSIPPSLSSLRSIKKLDLSANNLSGQIPKYFENLSSLKYLNLSYNDFEGDVPTKGVFSNLMNTSLVGNKKLCGGLVEMHLPSCHSRESKKSKVILLKLLIPVIVSCIIFLSALLIVVINTGRRKAANNNSRMVQMEEHFPMVSYVELKKATNDFSSLNLIGQGSHGFVYKGLLGVNNMLVAIKVINLQQKGASSSFMAECEALRNIRHRNLVKIISVCSSIDLKGDDFKALIFEYMQNGSLQEWLHQNNDQPDRSNLSLIQRLNVAIDVASAIEYLHHHCEPSIVHGDLKPSNVLLDHDMTAHVGDFGLAKIILDHSLSTSLETQSSSIGIKGTVGYVAPEYGMGSEVSMSGDVYSFGILLLEMFSGRRPTDSMFNVGLNLHDFAKMALPERLPEIVEPSLLLLARPHGGGKAKIEECLVGVLRIGVLCSMQSPTERMEMSNVVAKLCAVRENFLSRSHQIG